jgi:hypothetical protein
MGESAGDPVRQKCGPIQGGSDALRGREFSLDARQLFGGKLAACRSLRDDCKNSSVYERPGEAQSINRPLKLGAQIVEMRLVVALMGL